MPTCECCWWCTLTGALKAPPVSANPASPFSFAMANNVYQTKNYFMAAYHYVQCYASELVVPANTTEVARAVTHYYKRAQVRCVCTTLPHSVCVWC